MTFVNLITGERLEPQPWQEALAVGDYYLIETPLGQVGDHTFTCPSVYGCILQPVPGPGFFLVRAHSRWCAWGELGLFNICEATRQLTEAEFEAARAAGWP